jgi:dihydrofolate reductase
MPGRLIAQINASLDGYIEDEKHDIDWHFVDYEEFINETLRSLDGMIFGRKAYEPLSAYWPTAAANPDASVRHLEAATLMHEIPKYVVSTTLSGSDWNNTDVISGDVRTAVQDLKAASSRDIAVVLTYQPAHANQGNDPEGTEHEQ